MRQGNSPRSFRISDQWLALCFSFQECPWEDRGSRLLIDPQVYFQHLVVNGGLVSLSWRRRNLRIRLYAHTPRCADKVFKSLRPWMSQSQMPFLGIYFGGSSFCPRAGRKHAVYIGKRVFFCLRVGGSCMVYVISRNRWKCRTHLVSAGSFLVEGRAMEGTYQSIIDISSITVKVAQPSGICGCGGSCWYFDHIGEIIRRRHRSPIPSSACIW